MSYTHCDTFQIKYLHSANDIAYQVRILAFFHGAKTNVMQIKWIWMLSPSFFASHSRLLIQARFSLSQQIKIGTFKNFWTYLWMGKIVPSVYAHGLARIFQHKVLKTSDSQEHFRWNSYFMITTPRTPSLQQTQQCRNSLSFTEYFKSCHISNKRHAVLILLPLAPSFE